MPLYCVDVFSTVRHRFIVDAEESWEADKKARALVAEGTDEDLLLALKDWDIDETFVDKME